MSGCPLTRKAVFRKGCVGGVSCQRERPEGNADLTGLLPTDELCKGFVKVTATPKLVTRKGDWQGWTWCRLVLSQERVRA